MVSLVYSGNCLWNWFLQLYQLLFYNKISSLKIKGEKIKGEEIQKNIKQHTEEDNIYFLLLNLPVLSSFF